MHEDKELLKFIDEQTNVITKKAGEVAYFIIKANVIWLNISIYLDVYIFIKNNNSFEPKNVHFTL